jgi:hypothetical protein
MKMNVRKAARILCRLRPHVVIIASLLLRSTPILSTERPDPVLLPAKVHYTRNNKCTAVNIPMPPSTHSAVDGNMASPKPALMPLSQGDSAICFAYATADMISQRVGTEISALDVVTKYYFADPSRLAKSTNLDLRRHLHSMGNYRAAVDRSRAMTEISSDDNPGRYPYIDKLEGGEEDIAALLYNIGGICKDKDLPSYDGYTHHAVFLTLRRMLTRLLPSTQYSRNILGSASPNTLSPKTDAFNAAWIGRVEKQCRRRPSHVPLLPISYRVAANEASFMQLIEDGQPPSNSQVYHMFAMIDYALDHGRAPAVGYSWYVLEAAAPDETDLVADHSSVIIARRRVGTTCQYKVQDNTGEYCARMREGIRERCNLGRIWLAEDELKRTLYSVTYLR